MEIFCRCERVATERAFSGNGNVSLGQNAGVISVPPRRHPVAIAMGRNVTQSPVAVNTGDGQVGKHTERDSSISALAKLMQLMTCNLKRFHLDVELSKIGDHIPHSCR